jgi:hypothetical protein
MNAVTTIEPEEFRLPTTGSLSLALPEGLTFEHWQDVGRDLAAREKVLNWWIGDWWAFGEHRYGERAKVAAEGLFPLSFKRLANIGSVARAFGETSRQREVLSFTHHEEIAPLARQSPEAATMLLDRAEREGMSVAQVRAAVRVLQGRERDTTPAPDHDSLLASFLHHWNRLPREVRVTAAEMIAGANGEEIEPA